MKKFSFVLMSIILVLSMSNCKKSSSDDSGDESTPKPVPVTENITYDSSRSASNIQIVDKFNKLLHPVRLLSTTATNELTYDGRHLTKITSTSGGDVTVQNFYYHDMNKGLLDSVVTMYNNQFYGKSEYTISNDHITAITTYDENRQMDTQMTFSNYSNGRPANVGMLINDGQSGNIEFAGTVTFNGDDVVNVNLTGTFQGLPVLMLETFTYDDKKSEGLNVETVMTPLGAVHNATENNITLSMSGNTIYQSQTQTTYNYNGDGYPISATSVKTEMDYQGSTQVTTTSKEIIYEDK